MTSASAITTERTLPASASPIRCITLASASAFRFFTVASAVALIVLASAAPDAALAIDCASNSAIWTLRSASTTDAVAYQRSLELVEVPYARFALLFGPRTSAFLARRSSGRSESASTLREERYPRSAYPPHRRYIRAKAMEICSRASFCLSIRDVRKPMISEFWRHYGSSCRWSVSRTWVSEPTCRRNGR